MTGIGALIVERSFNLLELETKASALAFELVNGISDAVSDELSAVRPHAGQREIARRIREIISSSKLVTDRAHLQSRVSVIDNVYVTPEHIQDVYSFRCVPQILGPVLDTLLKSRADIDTELNSVTDNPIIDLKNRAFVHGGNFHGEYIAVAMDQMKAGIIKMTILSERRINFFLNRNVNQTLPPFLNIAQPGLTLGLQGLQFVATSTTAESQSLGFPHALHSISTNADNQDVVSMGTDAAFIAARAVENAHVVLAIELITLAQAVDVLDAEKLLSADSRALYRTVRSHVPVVREDRSLSAELAALITSLKRGADDSW
jgi:histidine ammonia-lyase